MLAKSLLTAAAVSLALPTAGRAAEPASSMAAAAAAPAVAPVAQQEMVAEPVYDGGLKGHWQDWGWAPRDTELGKPARLNMAGNGGWLLTPPRAGGQFHLGGVLHARSQQVWRFLGSAPGRGKDDTFPRIMVDAKHRQVTSSGWTEVRIPITELNPHNLPFDRLTLRASRPVDTDWVAIDKIAFLGSNAAGSVHAGLVHHSSMQVDCTKPGRAISPLIYGIAYNPRRNEPFQWRLGATARRWGGGPASRYNWRLGNAWNTGNDWFYSNVNYAPAPNYTWENFLTENQEHGIPAALTVPMLGWVAKDDKSYSYPVSVFGAQKAVNPTLADMGNGQKPNGARITSSDPRRTSIPAPPDFVGDWVQAVRRYDEEKQTHSVSMYILDNEPALWSATHRDVHPEPVGYDELLQRTIAYGTQVRHADPTALIAGPAEWGWPAYFYSAKDADGGFVKKPDRRSHSDEPLLAWYLKQLRAHEQRTGDKVLNVLDVHYYPQGTAFTVPMNAPTPMPLSGAFAPPAACGIPPTRMSRGSMIGFD